MVPHSKRKTNETGSTLELEKDKLIESSMSSV